MLKELLGVLDLRYTSREFLDKLKEDPTIELHTGPDGWLRYYRIRKETRDGRSTCSNHTLSDFVTR